MKWIKYAAWAALYLAVAYAGTLMAAGLFYLSVLIVTGGGGNR